jgi:transposase
MQDGLPEVLDQVIHPHGNRQGASVGWLTAAWLSYILSEVDHRMLVVEHWATQRLDGLSWLIPQPLGAKDFTDDRLADVLSMLSDDVAWEEIERQLGCCLMRVFDLNAGVVRLDSTAVAVHHDTEGNMLCR